MPGTEDRLVEALRAALTENSHLAKANAELTATAKEPIAIVGMGLRLPGGVSGPDDLWELLSRGGDAIGEFPTDRGWGTEALYDPDPDAEGKIYTRHGGFLYDAGLFDPAFFGISPREALSMDPQQRQLLETSWEALEHAGINPTTLRGQNVGVFTGLFSANYGAGSHADDLEGMLVTGASGSVAAGRVSYTLGVQGPAVTVDTACSSSLVALHLAAQAIHSGECTMALAGGATVMATPAAFVDFSRQRGLSADGRCRSFAESANGTGWSEGVGVLVLQRLSDAIRDGRDVLAVIRGTAVNQDGASHGLTAPNGPAQQQVIRQALANAGLTPADIDAVEAHGTGTTLGDPIEAQALIATYGQDRDQPLWLGSLKSNIGHTQAAAGVAGVAKMILAMQHGTLPQTLHVDQPSTKVDWTAGTVRLLAEPTPWPRTDHPRRAGVSSFGVSGTNAHLILEQAPPAETDPGPSTPLPTVPLVVTARSPQGLAAQADRLASFLHDQDTPLADAAAALVSSRAVWEHRAVVLATDHSQAVETLQALAAGNTPADAVQGQAAGTSAVGMLFAGQSTQRPGMGRDLYDTFPAFATAFDEACTALDTCLDGLTSVREVVFGDSPGIDDTLYAQAGLFALEVAMYRLTSSWGIQPQILAGHSLGEITAAHLAGIFDLPDAARLITARGRLMQALPPGGAMAAITATEKEIQAVLTDQVAIAAVNGPNAVVISGEAQTVHALTETFAAQGRKTKALPAHQAFHSPLIDPLLDDLHAVAETLSYHPPTIPLVSTVTGTITSDEMCTPEYWVQQARRPVRFADAVAATASQVTTLLELGPDGTLTALNANIEHAPPTIAFARGDRPETHTAITALAHLYVHGTPVDWTALIPAPRRPVRLPTTAFQHRRFWLTPTTATDATSLGQTPIKHPLMGAVVDAPHGEGLVLTGRVGLTLQPWLADHAIGGHVIVPATALVELAIQAGDHTDYPMLDELVIEAPMLLADNTVLRVQVIADQPDETGRRPIAIHSRPETGDPTWTRHATGYLSDNQPTENPPAITPWPPADAQPLTLEGFYDTLAERGYHYGPTFQGVRAAWQRGVEVFAEVALPEDTDATGYALHPALFDAALHAGLVSAESRPDQDGVALPFALRQVRLHASGATAARVHLIPADGRVSLDVADPTGAPVLSLGSLISRPLPTTLASPAHREEALYGIEWTALAAHPGPSAEPRPITSAADLREPLPPWLLLSVNPATEDNEQQQARTTVSDVLHILQAFLTEPATNHSHLIVATGPTRTDPVAAAVWGLCRTAQTEHPDRIVLAESDTGIEPLLPVLTGAVQAGEWQFALREDQIWVPRLVRADQHRLPVPDEPWALGTTGDGTLESLALLPNPDATAELQPGQVRVEVRAAGVDFRDVSMALGMDGRPPALGAEGAGVVCEVGPGVTGLAPGDRVMGLIDHAFGPLAVTDADLLAPIPREWTFEQAAGIPVVSLTAYYALIDLQPGQRVLVHGGTGGVGQAAIQIARHRGADVYATAHPDEHQALRDLGLDDDHIATSRSSEFEAAFLQATDGQGMDVILNSLTDASLRPHVSLFEAEPSRIGRMLTEVLDLFAAGALHLPPLTVSDIQQAPDVFRQMTQGGGKNVLTLPRTLNAHGTVLVTGGTGTLGAVVARHLATEHGIRHLLLASRRGPDAEGAAELQAELRAAGAQVRIVACDVADRDQVRTLLAHVPAEAPLTAVIHTAGILDDATITALDAERIGHVLAPKVDAALHLDALTRDLDLAAFVLFSSTAGVLGTPGQGNYAAANAFLDALAVRRRDAGHPATSLAWGLWAQDSGMAGRLDDTGLTRMSRVGIKPLDTAHGLRLLDTALRSRRPFLVPVALDIPALRAQARSRPIPALLRTLTGTVRRTAGIAGPAQAGIRARLAGLDDAAQRAALTDLVQTEAATVLGGAEGITPTRAFRDAGFDSLTAVELRNRLTTATGIPLPATLVFDHPNPTALAEHLHTQLLGADAIITGSATPVATAATDGPIAIVGMGLRLPGGVTTPEDLWHLLSTGTDAIGDFPTDRGWNLDTLYDPDPDAEGKIYTRHGGFLYDAGLFDPAFFGISPREALAMDPQQRLLLETSWEALEHAGINPTTLRGRDVGVFTGLYSGGYGSGAPTDGLEGMLGTGASGSVAAGRVSYTLGVQGPAVTVDTACSSSLVALHLAAQAIHSGECTMALASGATVMATPSLFVEFARQRGLSADGRCKAFAETADGAGWSEGVGVLVLQRLSDAIRDGRDILAVIKGTAINQDGASNGLTAPNGPAQQQVIRQALANARLTPADIDAVEAHGTGTTLGDPIEAQALLATYGQDRDQPLWLGSLKSNIGHTQAAAGVAGVAKMILAMRHGTLPQTLHIDQPSTKVDWTTGAVQLLTEPTPWPHTDHPRRAGISSFGVSGTNAHLILEQAPTPAPTETQDTPAPPTVPLVVTARSPQGLAAQADRLASFLHDQDTPLADAAAALLSSRAVWEHRAVVLATDHSQAVETLQALAAGNTPAEAVQGQATGTSAVGMLFAGQGTQRPGMGRDLYDTFPVFATAFDEACTALDTCLDGLASVRDVVFGDSPGIDDTLYAQAGLFALEVAMYHLARSWGIRPQVLAGHSLGEITAAHIAGVLDLPDAARLVTARGRLMQALPSGGAMAAITATEEEVLAVLDGQVSIAAINGPNAIVISGQASAVHTLTEHFAAQGRKTKILSTTHAFHSPLIDPLLNDLHAVAETLTYHPPTIPLISTVTGTITSDEMRTPEYWVQQARRPVRFADAVAATASQVTTLLELGPDGTLTALNANIEHAPPTVAFARGDRPETHTAITALAHLFSHGVPVDWTTLIPAPRQPVRLPTTAFHQRRFWLTPTATDATGLGQTPVKHPLLRAIVEAPGTEDLILTGRISQALQPWLADHAIDGQVIVPGTALVELAIQAADHAGCASVDELVMEAPMLLAEETVLRLRVVVGEPDGTGRWQVAIHSRPETGEPTWTRHAAGYLSNDQLPQSPSRTVPWPPADTTPVALEDFYDTMAERGYHYGPTLKGVQAAWQRGDEVFAEVALPEDTDTTGFALHPALFDAALHAALTTHDQAGDDNGVSVPFAFHRVTLHAGGATAVRVHLTSAEGGLSLEAADPAGAPVLSLGSVVSRPLPTALLSAANREEAMFGIEWTALPAHPGPSIDPHPITSAADLRQLHDGALPPWLLLAIPPGEPQQARTALGDVLQALQAFLTEPSTSHSRLIVATGPTRTDPVAAAIWGLCRTAQAEHPDRIVLAESDTGIEPLLPVLANATHAGEWQFAVREDQVRVPRLVRADQHRLPVPDGPWALGTTGDQTLESLALLPHPESTAELQPGQVRVEVRAAGVNFRDVLMALGVYPEPPALGAEGAGVVREVGPGVTGLAPGDRVMGLLKNAFGPLAITHAEALVPIPQQWSFEQAAGVPVVFLTAYWALTDLQPGQKVLVHSGTGGVGQAAIQLARHLGAEVYATAHPDKHQTLRDLGLDEDHIATSRSSDFEAAFLQATDGQGMDVILNSLTGDLTDASLRLLPHGGRFLEMGKTDIRPAEDIAAAYSGVSYRALDLIEAGPPKIGQMLTDLLDLFNTGILQLPPLTRWDIRQAPETFRQMAQGGHIGKNVLTLPRTLDPAGTVLVTGGTGTLGAAVARHLANEHGIRHLLLASRRGPDADGATDLRAELQAAGAQVQIVACDVTDRDQVRDLLAHVPADAPLTAVIHTAGVVDDGVITALDADRLDTTFAPKADAAIHLDDLTRDLDLAAFVLFSSAAGILGSPGQGNYAAANAFLDALAARRHTTGHPATSLAWGLWAQDSGMAGRLDAADHARMKRSGVKPLDTAQGLRLLDAALQSAHPTLIPVALDIPALRTRGRSYPLPALLRGLAGTVRRTAGTTPNQTGLSVRLAGLDTPGRLAALTDLVQTEAATVLGGAEGITPTRAFRDAGFDSLTAVELRNRLTAAAGIPLPATLVFDHPNPTALAEYLHKQLFDHASTAQPLLPTTAATDDPIAIVGMSLRLPGGVTTPEDLWRLLTNGDDGIGDFPTDRGWNIEALYDPDPDAEGKTYTRRGGFLHDASLFDPGFFGISPREALAMDPQQRLLLESSWEALEHAGINPTTLRGRDVGVFTGLYSTSYGAGAKTDGLGGMLGTGSAGSVAAGRVSYVLGVQGPAVTVDTACSSSLVAMHLAAQAIRSGECTMALAGGATVMATPSMFVEFSRQRGLSADGRCKSFAESADGAGWSEGVGVLVLQRLSDAQRDGRDILAVIKGSAVNQDGASNGLTAPNGPAQETVIRQALANAGLTPADIDAVEAHGTGTTLGDPIEAQALLATYGQDRDQPLWLGSLKSNIGHTQAAAGVAGVAKMILAMRHGTLPQTLHIDQPSTKVDWTIGAVQLLTEPTPWPHTDHPRRAGISSFGVSGTNAHLILEQAPTPAPRNIQETPEPPTVPLVVTARSPQGLAEQSDRLAAFLHDQDTSLTDTAATLLSSRALWEHRAVVITDNHAEAVAGLQSLAMDVPLPHVAHGTAETPGSRGKTVLVFPGQGTHWPGMGAELWNTDPVFAERMTACEQALAPWVDWSLSEVIHGTDELDRVDVLQPASFAVMVSLAAVWQAHGLRVDAVIGHSQGEIAAAHIAGALTLDDAAHIVAVRSQAIAANLSGHGGMMSVRAPEDTARETIQAISDDLEIAAVNGPSAVVLAGPPEALDQAQAAFQAHEIHTRTLPVDYASHTVQVDLLEEHLADAFAQVRTSSPAIPWFSTVTQDWITDPVGPDYWFHNLRRRVRFAPAIAELGRQGYGVFVESSPHPVLVTAVEETLDATGDSPAVVGGTLRRDQGDRARLLRSMADLFVHGVDIDWTSLTPAPRHSVRLPTTAFQRRRFWLTPTTSGDAAGLGQIPVSHPLVGALVQTPQSDEVLLTGRISQTLQPWLADHAIGGQIIVAGTALVELAVQAGDHTDHPILDELVIETPMLLPETTVLHLQVVVGAPDGTGRRPVGIHSRPETGDPTWTRHATGYLSDDQPTETTPLPKPWPPADAQPLALEDFYDTLAELGYDYGPAFQGAQAAWQRGEEVFAEVALPEGTDTTGFTLHPALFDAALHTTLGAARADADQDGAVMPFAFNRVVVHANGATAVRVRLTPAEDGVALEMADPTGAPVLSLGSLISRPVPAELSSPARHQDAMFRVEWTEPPVRHGTPITPQTVTDLREPRDGDLPPWLLLPVNPGTEGGEPQQARTAVSDVLRALQAFLADPTAGHSRLIVATGPTRTDPVAAAIWGLCRTAQAEHPDRIVLAEGDTGIEPLLPVLTEATQAGEWQFAVREGRVWVPRLVRADQHDLQVPDGPWALGTTGDGTPESLALLPHPEATAELQPGQVRVEVRAAGVNFRDVLMTLGMYPGPSAMGAEGAGIVREAGPGVTGLAPGDRVMGLIDHAFGPLAIAHADVLAPIPRQWSFEQAAAVPVTFLTAYWALTDLADLQPGQRVLIHAGTSGVGQAAIQLARHRGAEMYATAHPDNHHILRDLGLDDDHIATSRATDFEAAFLQATDGQGMDVVLNSLTGDLTDASLRLLPHGGRFLEMGKTDIRPAEDIAAAYPGVSYRALDLIEAGPPKIGQMLTDLLDLFDTGALQLPPLTTWDIRQAPETFRHMAQAGHIGKNVLTLPRTLDPAGTVLVTGGTGTLGAAVARHLANEHGIRHLLLASRRGSDADGAIDLQAELEAAGAQVQIVACDVADRDEVRTLLACVPAEAPLTAVIHTAGVVDDGAITDLSAAQLDTVFAPKADAAVHLDDLTRDLDLAAFVLFSSAAGTLGSPGQGNYAAANAFLDALATRRHTTGHPATSLAWGPWAQDGDRTHHLGSKPLDTAHGLRLLDTALRNRRPTLVPVALDLPALRAQARTRRPVPALLRALAGTVRRTASTATPNQTGLYVRLAGLDTRGRLAALSDLVHSEAAIILGGAEGITPTRAFRDVGFDSLTAVELRNRLTTATGIALPATVVFDYPNPTALAEHLHTRLFDHASAARMPLPTTAATDDPIAIVGMGLRLPGGVTTPEELWQLLSTGTDAIGDFPTDRGWDIESLYDPDPDAKGKTYARHGGFFHDAGLFDPGFFGISPREALSMDPQQRLLLETSWEALEYGGINPTSLRGQNVGVFTGLFAANYGVGTNADDIEGMRITGASGSVAAGRVSYVLGVQGPAVTVDTACSSSLVAIHLAAQAIRSGECTMALAGGATIMANPAAFIELSRQRGLAPDGRCKAFAESAGGTGWAEAVGVLVLQPLSDAQRDGRDILAVIKGTAVNQDGASNGLTAPNGPAQQQVIQQALANSGLTPADVDAVEAHGTGTALGDPIEAHALLNTYGQHHTPDRPLWLGSFKSNIGHAQAAAGVAGVAKMVQALRHSTLPQTLHVDEPSTKIDWASGAVRLLTESTPWPETGRPRRGGVSSFGVSGTNAHVILEQAPEPAARTAEPREDETGPTAVPLVVTARSPQGLAAQADRLASFLHDQDTTLTDTAAALLTSRAVWEHRAVVIADNHTDAVTGLRGLATDTPLPQVTHGTDESSGNPGKTVLVFPGQGAQWAGMGAELWDTNEVFAERMTACEQALAPWVDWSLSEVIHGADGAPGLDEVEVLQPVNFAMAVSLAAVWQAHGLRIDAVTGTSQGEIAAACVAGALSLNDAARIAAIRSQAGAGLSGGMMSITAGEDTTHEILQAISSPVEIAVINSPSAVVVAGATTALDEAEAAFQTRGIRTRRLNDTYFPSHSAQVDVLHDHIISAFQPIQTSTPTIPWYSTATNDWITDPIGPDYWFHNLRRQVGFAPAITELNRQGYGVFIETSPHPTLVNAIRETLEATGKNTAVIGGTLRRDQGDRTQLLRSMADLFVRGVPLDWSTLIPTPRHPVRLPTTAFQHRRYWLSTEVSALSTSDGDAAFWQAVEDGDLASLGMPEDDVASLTSALPVLSQWRKASTEQATARSWTYHVTWEHLPQAVPASPTGRWLLLADPHTLDPATAEELGAPGLEVSTAAFSPDPDELAAQITQAGPLDGVLCLPHTLEHLTTTIQALLRTGTGPRLWCVTRGAVAATTTDTVTSPRAAQLWGLGRVAALEHPALWGGLIDLPPAPESPDADTFPLRALAFAAHSNGEDQVAIRTTGVLGRRLTRPDHHPAKPGWRPRGTVLITGGTGALGTHLARWTAAQGAEQIVLVSRSGTLADPHALDDLDVPVTTVACDVTDRDALAAVLAEYPPDAVIHAAGIGGGPVAIADATPAHIAEVCDAKVEGAALLDELLADRPLDAFILYSSVAGIWGSAGQGAYAAANAYLDALAHHRRDRGATALSLAWGGWAGEGMIEDNDAEEHLRRRAILSMPPATALTALHQATGQDQPTAVITRIGWQQFAAIFTAARPSPLLSALPDAQDETATTADQSAVSNLLAQLAALDAPDQITALTDLVQNHAAAVLGGTEGLTPTRAFRDSGFDSLTAVELRNHLSAATGIPLPATVVFDHPNATALAEHLHAQLFESVPVVDETSLRQALATTSLSRFRELGVLDTLLRLTEKDGAEEGGTGQGEATAVERPIDEEVASVDEMTPDALIRHVLGEPTS